MRLFQQIDTKLYSKHGAIGNLYCMQKCVMVLSFEACLYSVSHCRWWIWSIYWRLDENWTGIV